MWVPRTELPRHQTQTGRHDKPVMGEFKLYFPSVLLIGPRAINRNTVPSNEEVRGKPWYYGPISRGDCDNLMAERGQDGDFLVRDSESNVSQKIVLQLA